MTVFLLITGLLGFYFGPPLLVRYRQLALLRKACNGKLAITYDDGPDEELTPQLLGLLKRHAAQCTFFLVGFRAEDAPHVCDLMLEDGHELGIHSHRHKNAWKMLPWDAVRDAEKGYATLSRWVGAEAAFRPPFGKTTSLVLWAIRRRGARIIWWTDVAGDTSDPMPCAERVAMRILDAGGGVVLMHSRHKEEKRRAYVLDLTERLLQGAQERGISVCPLSDILETL